MKPEESMDKMVYVTVCTNTDYTMGVLLLKKRINHRYSIQSEVDEYYKSLSDEVRLLCMR
jgi:hypothetical protein